MYEKKDLRTIQILQKAREFADSDLLNEDLLNQLLNANFQEASTAEKEKIIAILNSVINAKNKARLSNS